MSLDVKYLTGIGRTSNHTGQCHEIVRGAKETILGSPKKTTA